MKLTKKQTCEDALIERILLMEIEPGAVLDESVLSQEFDLSRTPLREVFQRLAGEGYLTLEENRGAKVSSMDISNMHHFFQTAPMIYSAIAKLAAENSTTLQIETLKQTQRKFDLAVQNKDIASMSMLNHEFHRLIGEMAGNVYLTPSLKRLLIDHTRMSQMFYNPDSSDDEQRILLACQQHEQMIEAIENRMPDVIVQLTLDHWALSRDRIEKFVRPDPLPMNLDIGNASTKKENNMQFEGIYTPVVTPYHEDHSINKKAFEQVIEHLISTGVHGIIVAGTTGEYYAQSAEERVAMMKLAKKIIGKRIPMIVGTGAIRTEDSIYFAKEAKAIGADALLIATPPYAYPTGREIALHALAIDREANLPAMLYNYPGRMSVNMDEETLDRLGRSPNFCAIKESSGDPNRLHMLARDYPHIALSCGMDDQALEFFAWGARSWVCAGSNFAPEAHIALYKACALEGNFTKGRAIMSAMLPLMRVLEQGGKFVQCIKHGLTLRGIDCGPPRRPLQPLNKDDKRELAEVIRTMNSSIAAIERGEEA